LQISIFEMPHVVSPFFYTFSSDTLWVTHQILIAYHEENLKKNIFLCCNTLCWVTPLAQGAAKISPPSAPPKGRFMLGTPTSTLPHTKHPPKAPTKTLVGSDQ
jgi:hypothetical protein